MSTFTGDIREEVIIVGISGASSSGKTTVSQLLKKLFKNSILIHEDDYYKNDKDIPMDETLGEQNWDCPEAIDFELFEKHLRSFKDGLSSEITNHSIQPQYETMLDPEVESKLTRKIKEKLPEVKYRFVFIDGFLLYLENSKLLTEILDIKLFFKVSFELLKQRRESREGYATKDSFWVDPPGYFEKLVYPNYKKNHQFLFLNGDIEGEREILGNDKYNIEMLNITDESTTITDILEWSVERILLHF